MQHVFVIQSWDLDTSTCICLCYKFAKYCDGWRSLQQRRSV